MLAWTLYGFRSAKRSLPAARAATAEGYTAYNILTGFIGVLDKATGELGLSTNILSFYSELHL
jgi:hypothetical protein